MGRYRRSNNNNNNNNNNYSRHHHHHQRDYDGNNNNNFNRDEVPSFDIVDRLTSLRRRNDRRGHKDVKKFLSHSESRLDEVKRILNNTSSRRRRSGGGGGGGCYDGSCQRRSSGDRRRRVSKHSYNYNSSSSSSSSEDDSSDEFDCVRSGTRSYRGSNIRASFQNDDNFNNNNNNNNFRSPRGLLPKSGGLIGTGTPSRRLSLQQQIAAAAAGGGGGGGRVSLRASPRAMPPPSLGRLSGASLGSADDDSKLNACARSSSRLQGVLALAEESTRRGGYQNNNNSNRRQYY